MLQEECPCWESRNEINKIPVFWGKNLFELLRPLAPCDLLQTWRILFLLHSTPSPNRQVFGVTAGSVTLANLMGQKTL